MLRRPHIRNHSHNSSECDDMEADLKDSRQLRRRQYDNGSELRRRGRESQPTNEGIRRAMEVAIGNSARAASLLDRIRSALRSRTQRDTMLQLARCFRKFASSPNGPKGNLDAVDILQGLKQVGIGVEPKDAQAFLDAVDLQGHGSVSCEECLSMICGPLNSARLAVVREVFRNLDANRDGFLTVSEIRSHFQASRHPEVEVRRSTEREALLTLLGDIAGDGRGERQRISAAEFVRYCELISAGIDQDQYFAHLVRSTWGVLNQEADIRREEDAARNRHVATRGHIYANKNGLCANSDTGLDHSEHEKRRAECAFRWANRC